MVRSQRRPPSPAANRRSAPAKGTAAPARTRTTLAQYRAYIALIQAAEHVQRGFAELFREHDLSNTQYNVLRILRGAGAEGATCGDVAGSLIQHDPDVTRLLDRLERRGLIERSRDAADRRVVRTRITAAGAALLAELDAPVDALHARQFGHLSEARLAELAAMMDDARARSSS